MSALVVIVCDVCGDHGGIGPTPQEARAELRSWVRRQGVDMCPLCRLVDDANERASSTRP